MSIERKANRVLEQAKALAETVESWAEFSVAVFDQFSGIVAKTFSSGIERQAFYDTDQYKQIQGILTSLDARRSSALQAALSLRKRAAGLSSECRRRFTKSWTSNPSSKG